MSNDTMAVYENLMIAAMVIVGGGRLVKIDVGDRISRVYVDVSNWNGQRLADDFTSLAADARALPSPIDVDATVSAYSASALGRIEQQYRLLKRTITRGRGRR